MVKGEQVRVAGANVGEVESVGVTLPGEIDSYEHGKPEAVPGKAVIVMKIEDPGFQDFREDATCLIRPQSLIGEKYLDCRPTLPRAPGSKPPPPLNKIPEGQPGAGERLLPLENNSTSVDPDLINDIHSLPYAQRFRLIFNELGATLAGRGDPTSRRRSNAPTPTFATPTACSKSSTSSATNWPSSPPTPSGVTRPLAEQRQHVAGFLANAGAAGQATAERGAELEASLQQVPPVPARVPDHDEQPQGLLRRGHAGLLQPRPGDPGADRSDPQPEPVHRRLDRRPEVARQRRRSVGPDLRRRRPGRQEGPRPGQARESARRPNSPSSWSARRRPGASTTSST